MFKRLFGGRGDEAAAPQPAAELPGPALGTGPAMPGSLAGSVDGAQHIGLGTPPLGGAAAAGLQATNALEPGADAPDEDGPRPGGEPALSEETADEPPVAGEDEPPEAAEPEQTEETHEHDETATETPAVPDEPPAETVRLDADATAAADGVDASPTLEPGTSVGGRYTIAGPLSAAEAGQLLGVNVEHLDAAFFAVDDTRGYERCWSCGSTNNEAQQRFCVDCGAPLQHRQGVLARTEQPTGEADEFEEGGLWYHLIHPLKQFGSTGMILEAGGYSAEGPHHPNEDSYWSALAGGCYDSASETFGVFALADGMGGYAPGSGLVSKDIVRTVGRGIFGILDDELDRAITEDDLQAIIRGAIAQANDQVLDAISREGDMGATLVVAVIYGPTVYIANVGDSRAYYVSPTGNVTQITRDQSLVEQQIAAGLLSPEAAYTGIGNNVILHAIGEEGVEDAADWYTHPVEPGSRLLLCSDGYWKTMGADVWLPDQLPPPSTLHRQAQAMVEQALGRDTDDNTTVLLVGVD